MSTMPSSLIRRRRGAGGPRSSCRSGRSPACCRDRVEGPLDEVVAALREDLDRHVVGDVPALDELAAEVEVGLAGAREADLDLLVAHPHEELEHAHLALGVHRVDEPWLPSRRSTAHQRGAFVIVRSGQVRSGRWTSIWSWNGTYFAVGIPEVCWGWIISALRLRLVCGGRPGAAGAPRRGAADVRPRRGSAKEEARGTHTSSMPQGSRGGERCVHDSGRRAHPSRRSTTTATCRRTVKPRRW